MKGAALIATSVTALITGASSAAAEFVLRLPIGATETYNAVETDVPNWVPVGPFNGEGVPLVDGAGQISRSVWRFGAEQSLPEIEANIIAQLDQAGYDIVLNCVASACGGFDFRFAVPVVDPPDMFVDLRAFRFLTAQLPSSAEPLYLTFLLSRSPQAAYVQMMQYGLAATGAPTPSVETVVAVTQDLADEQIGQPARPVATVLEGLTFEAGSATLGTDPNNSLARLAKIMADHPELTVMLVGHSDLSGGLELNISLSKARADAVRSALIADHDIAGARLSAHGVGPLSPRADNDTDAGKEKNRRVVAVFSW